MEELQFYAATGREAAAQDLEFSCCSSLLQVSWGDTVRVDVRMTRV